MIEFGLSSDNQNFGKLISLGWQFLIIDFADENSGDINDYVKIWELWIAQWINIFPTINAYYYISYLSTGFIQIKR